jgi:hypothetical protein
MLILAQARRKAPASSRADMPRTVEAVPTNTPPDTRTGLCLARNQERHET